MKKYQKKTPPGDPLAVSRGYCSCPSEQEKPHEANDERDIVGGDCPLHGDNPRDELPEGI